MSSSSKGQTIWLIAIVVGVVVALLSWIGMGEYRQSKGWPATEAVVKLSEMRVPPGQKTDGPSKEKATIRFVYTVDGVEFSSGRYNKGFSGGKNLVEEYPVGTKITINYDPLDPDNGWFDAAGHSRWYMGLGVSLVLLVAGGAMLARGLSKK